MKTKKKKKKSYNAAQPSCADYAFKLQTLIVVVIVEHSGEGLWYRKGAFPKT